MSHEPESVCECPWNVWCEDCVAAACARVRREEREAIEPLLRAADQEENRIFEHGRSVGRREEREACLNDLKVALLESYAMDTRGLVKAMQILRARGEGS